MTEIDSFAADLLFVSIAIVAAVFSNRLSAAIRIPAPALFLIGLGAGASMGQPL